MSRPDSDEAIIRAMKTMVKAHVCFGKDGGIDRDSCWDNLAITVQEEGLLPTWGPLWGHLEHAFDAAWPRGNPQKIRDTPWAGPDKIIRERLFKNNDSYLVVDRHGLGDTWMAGGCWVAAEAIRRRFGGNLVGIWDASAGLCHVVVEKRGVMIDAEGKPAKRATFLARYAKAERLKPPVYAEVFQDHQAERAGILYDEEAVVETMTLLEGAGHE